MVVPDPFDGMSPKGMDDYMMIYTLSGLLPMILLFAMQYSPSYRAAWVFFATPLDRQRLLTATRDIATVSVVIPLFIALTGILTYYFGSC